MIKLCDLTLGYGHRTVLSHISLALERGSFCAVMGANGCGKTTLLRCVGGLMRPLGGQVLVGGHDVATLAARPMAQLVAYVQQHPQTDFEFSAFETVLMGRNPYQRRLENESQADWDIVEQAMRQTGTWHLRLAKLDEISGGELQRVMLARAIAQQTPVMLLDEPVSNLDVQHQFGIMDLLGGVEGKTILIVLHDLNLALRYCPSLILIGQGGVVYHGPTCEGLTPENIERVFGVSASVDGGYIRFLH
ncbi:MAG: ABC transporter ATP-binding protein [Bacteroidales bacterium]|nr:ABC transporter ATP-binding protein [Bacteroidales bacterium]